MAAKAAADQSAQFDLFGGGEDLVSDLVVAVVADPDETYLEFFLGLLGSEGGGRYFWRDRVELGNVGASHGGAPAEAEATPIVELSRARKKSKASPTDSD